MGASRLPIQSYRDDGRNIAASRLIYISPMFHPSKYFRDVLKLPQFCEVHKLPRQFWEHFSISDIRSTYLYHPESIFGTKNVVDRIEANHLRTQRHSEETSEEQDDMMCSPTDTQKPLTTVAL